MLTAVFVLQRLSHDCEDHVRTLTIEAMKDYQQDPALARKCTSEVCRDLPFVKS